MKKKWIKGLDKIVILVAITTISIFYFLIIERNNQNKKRRERLDKYYFKEMSTPFHALNDPKATKDRIIHAYDWIKEIEEHMSKDGYDWQQITQMKNKAKEDQIDRRWKIEIGYADGIKNKNPDKNYQKDPYYQYGFKKGKEDLKK